MQYRLIDAHQAGGLVLLVNQAVEDGWVPHGGVCVVPVAGDGGTGLHFYQAVVKDAPADPRAAAVAQAVHDLAGDAPVGGPLVAN
jgi:hypothetical protein